MIDKEDMAFGRAAVAFGFINSNQLASCMQKHIEAKRKGSASSICDLMQQSGIITTAQISVLKRQSFGRYKILDEIGRGGMGAVYKAYDSDLDRIIALKRLLTGSSEEAVQRFLQEAKATAKLKHPNIVMVYDIGNEAGENYFAMDYIEGLSLKDHIKQKRSSTSNYVEILIKVCTAIHYAHENGIIHRDLKPANIMMDENNEPKVMDFGLAKVTQVSKDLSMSGTIIGTLEYMPPEQAEGRRRAVDARSDVYSLGAIFYEMITGRPPFKGTSLSNILSQVLNEDPIPLTVIKPRTPKTLESICLKALAKKKEHRYKSAAAMAQDLSRYAKGETVKVKKMGLAQNALKTVKQNQLLVSLGLSLMILVVGGLSIHFLWQTKYDKMQKSLKAKIKKSSPGNIKRVKQIMDKVEIAKEGLPITGLYVPELKSFDRVISRLMIKHNIPGGALAVVKDGRLIYARGFGYANKETKTVVKPTSLFRVFSASKPITAVAIMKLIEQQKISLEDKAFGILSHLKPPPGKQPDRRLYQITIRHLLEHTGGWDNKKSGDPMFGLSKEATAALKVPYPASAETIIRYMMGEPLDFAPGTRYIKSNNLGYCILGRIIEKVSGLSYEEYVRENILKPAGIKNMHLAKTRLRDQHPDEVMYYDYPGIKEPSVFADVKKLIPPPYGSFYIEAMDSHGGWVASVIDLMRFVMVVDGRGPQPDILNKNSIVAMTAKPSYKKRRGQYYAKGWLVHSNTQDWWHPSITIGNCGFLARVGNGAAWAAIMNYGAYETPDYFVLQLNKAIWEGYNGIKTFPKHNLFDKQ